MPIKAPMADVDGMVVDGRPEDGTDMEFFAKVQATMGLRGNEMLLIDDSRKNVEATRMAGWQAADENAHRHAVENFDRADG